MLSILMKRFAGWCGPGSWEADLCREGTVTLTLELPLDFLVYYVGGTAICRNQKDGGWDFLEKMCNAHNLFTRTSFNMHLTLDVFEESKKHMGSYLTSNPWRNSSFTWKISRSSLAYVVYGTKNPCLFGLHIQDNMLPQNVINTEFC